MRRRRRTACDKVSDKAAHEWNDGVIIEEATAEKDGVKKYTCEVCNYEKNESYSLTPDTPDPVDYISIEFENMLTAVAKTRKNRPEAIKKTFYLGANGMSLNAETVVFADGRTATKQVRTMGSDSSADYAFLTGANGKYYNKKRITSGNGNILFIDSPVPKSFADTAFGVLFEQMLYYCRDKKECETFYPLMLKNSFVMGVFEKTTGKFAVPELSDIEYNITCSMSLTDSYNEILVHITVKDDYFKSVIGAGGETLNMMTFSLTIKYDDDGLIGAKFYQGVTYTESDGVTVITNESYFEYTVLRDVTEGTALYNEVKKAVYFGENATEEGQQVSIGIIANGAYLDSSYFGSYNISSPALYAELKAKIDRFAGEIEKVAPGKFTVEAFLDEKFTVAFDENYSIAYYDEFFSPRIYLRVTSISGEDCIAFLSYYKTGSDHILSMGGSGTLGTKAVVFKKTDAYKIDTQFESETYGDLICVNDIYTKSDVYDASKSDLLIIECHKCWLFVGNYTGR